MSNYTKTTDFEAKDSLPTGDSGKIIRGAEFETEFDAIATAIATKADTAGPTFTGTLTFDTISDGTISIAAFVDEDDMSSNSAVLVPTQQSVKAYVDAVTTELNAQDLDFQADSGGALSIDLDTETMTFTGGTGIDTSGALNAVTFAIDSTVATLTGTQTLTNKTLTSPDVNTPDIDGGTIDGATIATSDITVGTGKTLDVSGGTLTLANDQISGDKVEGGTIASTTITSLASTTVDTTNLEVTNIKAKDGTAAGSIADTTGVVTLASSVLTTTDINGGTIDGATIGGTTAAAGSFTTVSATGNITVDGTVDGRDVATDGTKLDTVETNADVTDTTNVTAAGAVMDSELTNETAVKSLDQGVATTDSPTFAGLTTTANVSFGDNDKAIFGAGSDLQIYHDSNNSYIVDSGDGNLYINANDLRLGNADNSKDFLHGNNGAEVKLFYDNNLKLATTNTGIDVTGTVTADGLTVDGNATISNATNPKLEISDTTLPNTLLLQSLNGDSIVGTSSNTSLALKTNNLSRISLANNGDISFYEDTGTTAKLFWDASAESLGIGTSAPGSLLELEATGSTVFDGTATDGQAADGTTLAIQNLSDTNNTFSQILFRNRNTSKAVSRIASLTDSTGTEMAFVVENNGSPAEVLRLEKTGNVGIGTSSPDRLIHASGGSGSTIAGKFETASTSGSVIVFKDADTTTNDLQVRIGSDANDLVQYAGGSERLRIDSSGNVGIGISSPPAKLSVFGTGAGNATVQIEGEGGADPYINFLANNAQHWSLGVDDSDADKFKLSEHSALGTNDYLVVDVTGQVGIGTSSPDTLLHLSDTAGGAVIRLERNDTSIVSTDVYGEIQFEGQDASAGSAAGIRGKILGVAEGATGEMALAFQTASGYSSSTERMRIDSSGNLLVAQTSQSPNTVGISLNNNGNISAKRDGGIVGLFNRGTSDGTIVDFRKDDTTVGSIGSRSSVVSYIVLDPRTGVKGAALIGGSVDANEGIINPGKNDGDIADAAISFGTASSRFKDLYLSGGVYLGGTGSANKLDDYEEGTFTLTVAGDATGAFGTEEGVYTKIGRLVFVEIYFTVSTNFTGSFIGGLPFTVANLVAGTSFGQSGVVLTSAADTVTGAAQEATTNVAFYNDHNVLSTHTPTTTNSAYRLSLCYQV